MGTDNCNPNAICTNTIGGFNCSCKTGFSGDGINCVGNVYLFTFLNIFWEKVINIDIDECKWSTNNCDDQATCTNTIGSFNCTCNTGYSGNGTICEGIFFFLKNSKNSNH